MNADQMTASARPWKMLLPLLIVLLLFAAWSAYWLIASGYARSFVDERRDMLRQQGLSLACTDETWGGFPFRFEFSCTSPVLTAEGRAELKSANLQLVALAYNPRQVVMLLDGPTSFSGQGVLPQNAEHERIIASVTASWEGKISASMEIPKLHIPALVSADRLLLHTRPEPESALGLAVTIEKLNYQPEGRPPLAIDRGDAMGRLTSQNMLMVDRIELQQGTVRYWGAGETSLDTERRLSGKLATETNDLDGLLALLEPHLGMNDDEKARLRMVLGLLGKQAKADIIARDGLLYIGPFKVADLRPLY